MTVGTGMRRFYLFIVLKSGLLAPPVLPPVQTRHCHGNRKMQLGAEVMIYPRFQHLERTYVDTHVTLNNARLLTAAPFPATWQKPSVDKQYAR